MYTLVYIVYCCICCSSAADLYLLFFSSVIIKVRYVVKTPLTLSVPAPPMCLCVWFVHTPLSILSPRQEAYDARMDRAQDQAALDKAAQEEKRLRRTSAQWRFVGWWWWWCRRRLLLSSYTLKYICVYFISIVLFSSPLLPLLYA